MKNMVYYKVTLIIYKNWQAKMIPYFQSKLCVMLMILHFTLKTKAAVMRFYTCDNTLVLDSILKQQSKHAVTENNSQCYKGCYNSGYVWAYFQILLSLFTVCSCVCLRLPDLNRYDNLIGRVADRCTCRGGGLYGQHPITGQRRTDVLQVHPLWQPWRSEEEVYQQLTHRIKPTPVILYSWADLLLYCCPHMFIAFWI